MTDKKKEEGKVKKSFCQQCLQWDSLGIWVNGSELENGENTKTQET